MKIPQLTVTMRVQREQTLMHMDMSKADSTRAKMNSPPQQGHLGGDMKRPSVHRSGTKKGGTPEIIIVSIYENVLCARSYPKVFTRTNSFNPQTVPQVGHYFTPTSQMSTLKSREVKPLAQSHKVTQPVNDRVRS